MIGSGGNPAASGTGVLELWSIGVLDVLETEVYKPRFSQYGAMIICSVDVWV